MIMRDPASIATILRSAADGESHYQQHISHHIGKLPILFSNFPVLDPTSSLVYSLARLLYVWFHVLPVLKTRRWT